MMQDGKIWDARYACWRPAQTYSTETLTASAARLLSRADAVIHTDAVGNRFRKVFASDLDALALALPSQDRQP